jgi:phosphoribosylformylglycinamidine synthase
VIGVLGVIQDVARRTPMGFGAEGETILLLGETRDELAGSAWAGTVHDHLGGRPPAVDLAGERRMADVLVGASSDGLLSAAHDVADGGLAQALVEMALRGGRGAAVRLPDDLDPFVALFAESAGRVVVVVPSAAEARFADLCAELGVRGTPIGSTGGATLDVQGLLTVGLDELRSAYEGTLPALFG